MGSDVDKGNKRIQYRQRKDFFGKKPSVLPALKRRKKRIRARFK